MRSRRQLRPEATTNVTDYRYIHATKGFGAVQVLIASTNMRISISNHLGHAARLAMIILLVALRPSLPAAQEAPMTISGATTLNADGVIDLILRTPDLVVVDTRTKADFDGGHIEGAINVVDTEINSDSVLAAVVPSRSTPVLFYCNGLKCGRAAKATARAIEWGYSKIYYYALGINDWKSAQLPLVTE